MRILLSKMPITGQFMLLATLGVALTLAKLGLTLKRSYDLAFEAKRSEVRHMVEAATAIVQSFVRRERSGALTRAEAQKDVLAALQSVRYDGANYIFVYDFDGVALANGRTEIIGTNRMDQVDSSGKPFVRAFVDIAKSGQAGFVDYLIPKPGDTEASPKMTYVMGVADWRWVVGTGLYVDDVTKSLMTNVTHLAILFIPLFAGFMMMVFVMRGAVASLLKGLADSMRRLARGDLDTAITGLGRHDEIGQMADALVVFRQAAIDTIALQRQAESQRLALDTERSRKAEIDHAATRANRAVVESLGAALASLSRGDLGLNVAESYAAEYEEIRANFNAAVAQLRDTMTIIASNTKGIRTGSVEIATAADDLAQRTESQAATLAETAATLNQIAATVGETAQGALQARRIVASAMEDAANGSVVVRGAVSAMSEIETSAQQIAQIIGVIDEIAFQTNLLALNAGVEAARAGDAGRGFAVVASEVRGLAQRSAEAAKDIKALITASSAQVGKGVTQVAETGTALERIQGRIQEVNDLVAKIAASAQSQASSLGDVNTAIEQMDKATQQNAAMVEESTAASHSLASEADQLASLINRFSLGTNPHGMARRAA